MHLMELLTAAAEALPDQKVPHKKAAGLRNLTVAPSSDMTSKPLPRLLLGTKSGHNVKGFIALFIPAVLMTLPQSCLP